MVTNPRPFNVYDPIAPDDSVNLPKYTAKATVLTDAIYVGTGGDVVAVMGDGTAVTFKTVPTGAFLPIAAKRVNATSTTALNLVACYWI